MKPSLILSLCLLSLAACREGEAPSEVPVRGMKARLVTATPTVATRRFPAVLEPSEITALSLEIAGVLEELNLAVGQRVEAGERLTSLERTTLELQVASAQAALDQTRSNAKNAMETLERQKTLLQSGTVTRVEVEARPTFTRKRTLQKVM